MTPRSIGIVVILMKCAVFLTALVVDANQIAHPNANRNVLKKPVYRRDVNVTCGSQDIIITIADEYIRLNSKWISSGNRLCLEDRKCCARYTAAGSFSITISDNFAKCGNKISTTEILNEDGELDVTHYKFSNRLIYNTGSGSITRDIDLIKFNCLYSTDILVTAQPDDRTVSSHVIKIKTVAGDMSLFRTKRFNDELEQPPALRQNEPVFIKIKITDPGLLRKVSENVNIVSVVKQCSVKDKNEEHQLIENGCPLYEEKKIRILSNGESLHSEFGIEMFRIVSLDSNNATISCITDLCVNDEFNSCIPVCGSRKRRSANATEENAKKESDTLVRKQRKQYYLEFDGKKFSTTILLKNHDNTNVEATTITNLRSLIYTSSDKYIKEGDKVVLLSKTNKETLLIYIFGAFGFILVVTFFIILTMVIRRAHKK